MVSDLPLDSRAKMRVAFEITGQGEVWLDNVKLHDLLFPFKYYEHSQSELLQLFKFTHAAQTAQQRGQIHDCVQILDGYWMHFIDAYTQPVIPKIAAATTPVETTQATPPDSSQLQPTDSPAAGFSDRLKRMVPKLR
jgi:hypothetical protein